MILTSKWGIRVTREKIGDLCYEQVVVIHTCTEEVPGQFLCFHRAYILISPFYHQKSMFLLTPSSLPGFSCCRQSVSCILRFPNYCWSSFYQSCVLLERAELPQYWCPGRDRKHPSNNANEWTKHKRSWTRWASLSRDRAGKSIDE